MKKKLKATERELMQTYNRKQFSAVLKCTCTNAAFTLVEAD